MGSMITYTEEQKKIFNHDITKNARILAGPGTGKSVSILHFLNKVRANDSSFCVQLITFTRSANNELVEKVDEEGLDSIPSNTVHSYAISILTKNVGSANISFPLRIVDTWEWKNLVRHDLSLYCGTNVSNIEKLKNAMSSSWETLEEDALTKGFTENMKNRFLRLWEEHRSIFAYTLLAELPYRLLMALERHPDLELANLNLLVVDEYQDLNACDQKCIKTLSDKGVSVFAIGDDDQSIYKFRNASPNGIRNFVNDFNAEDYTLSISHRCGSKILRWANEVIQGDTTRGNKTPLQPSDSNPEGEVRNLVFNRENSEADGISTIIKWLIDNRGLKAEDILLLTRTKNGMRELKESFDRNGIEYLDPYLVKELLSDVDYRGLVSLLRLTSYITDSLSWRTLLYLENGIGNSTYDAVYKKAKEVSKSFGEVMNDKGALNSLDISKNQIKKIKFLIQKTITTIDSIGAVPKCKCGEWIQIKISEGMLPNIPENLLVMLLKMDDVFGETTLTDFINHIEPVLKDFANSKKEGSVRIMTLASSKGLSSKAVILAGIESQIIPFPNSDRQEEIRLLYVGMTRAREYLYVTSARRRIGPSARIGNSTVGSQRQISPFLEGTFVQQEDGKNYINALD